MIDYKFHLIPQYVPKHQRKFCKINLHCKCLCYSLTLSLTFSFISLFACTLSSLSFSLSIMKDKESETDIDEQRPMTPAERSASRASHSVYGTDKEDNEDEDYDKEYLLTMKPVTPHSRPSSHLEKVLGGVMNVTEDLVMGGNPNLAKVWGQAYKREIETEKRSRSPSPAENQHIEDTPQKQEEIKREQTPLLRRHYVPPKPSFKKRQVMALCKLLKALFPFGKEFLSLSILRKIFFIIKVVTCSLL